MPWFRDLLGITVVAVAWYGWALLDNAPNGANPIAVAIVWLLAWVVTAAFLMRALSILVVDGLLVRGAGLKPTPFVLLLLRMAIVFAVTAVTLKYGLGFDIGALLTTSVVLTGVIGLALQSTLSGLFSGIALQTEQRIRAGDVLHLSGANAEIEYIGWRSIIAKRADGVRVMLPNTVLATTMVTFSRAGAPVRCEVVVPAPLAAPPALISEIIRGTVAAVPRVSPAHAIVVEPASFNADRGLMEMRAQYWSAEDSLGQVILRQVWYAFQRHGIVMPASSMKFDDTGLSEGDTRLIPSRDLLALTATLRRAACCRDWAAEQLESAANGGRLLMFAPHEAVELPAGCAERDAAIVAGGAFAVGPDSAWIAPPVAGEVAPVRSWIDPERRLAIQAQYAEAVGPVAHQAVLRAVEAHSDEYTLYRALAADIPSQPARERFLRHGPSEPMTPFGAGTSFRVGAARGAVCGPPGRLIAATHLEILVLPAAPSAPT